MCWSNVANNPFCWQPNLTSPQKLTFWVLCLSEWALETPENSAAPWKLISSKTWVHIPAWQWLHHKLQSWEQAHAGWTPQLVSFWEDCCSQPVHSLKHLHPCSEGAEFGAAAEGLGCGAVSPLPGPGPFRAWDGPWGCIGMASQLLLPPPVASELQLQLSPWLPGNTVAGCEPGEQKRPSSVYMHSLGLQGRAGLQLWIVLLFSLGGLFRVKRFGGRLGSPIFSTGLIKLKLLLRGTFFGKFFDGHSKAVLLACSAVNQEGRHQSVRVGTEKNFGLLYVFAYMPFIDLLWYLRLNLWAELQAEVSGAQRKQFLWWLGTGG